MSAPNNGMPSLRPSVHPTDEEWDALLRWPPSSEGMLTKEMIEEVDGDAPPGVLSFFERREAAIEEWEKTAKDRPLSWSDHTAEVRFFNGPWIPHREVDAACTVEATREDGVRVAAPVFDIYFSLVEKGEIEKCRKLAGAIYEHLQLTNKTRLAMIELAIEAEPEAPSLGKKS